MFDVSLLSQLREGNREAFNSLFRHYYPRVMAYVVAMVEQEVAEDVVQEVFIAIWESDKKYNSYHGFRAFLYDSVKNRCLNYLKHQEVERRHAEILLWEQDEEDEDYRLMREEMYRALHRAVDELPERCRQVFKLHLQGEKNEEIAQILELSVETVKTQKKKAMYFLRERLGKSYYLLIILNIIDL